MTARLKYPINGSEHRLARARLDVDLAVTRIDAPDTATVNRLASLGILPGASLRLVQNRGAFVALVERDQVAFDRHVASAVWVRVHH